MPVRFRKGTATNELWTMVHYIGAFRHTDLKLWACGCRNEKDVKKRQAKLQQAERRLREDGYLTKLIIEGQWFVKKKVHIGPEPYKGAFEEQKRAVAYFYSDGKNRQLKRARRLSQTVLFFNSAGCDVLPEDKPEVGNGTFEDGLVFYAPRELSDVISTSEQSGIRGSRATGFVLTKDSIFAAYIVSARERAIGDMAEIRVEKAAARLLDHTRKERTYEYSVDAGICLLDHKGGIRYLLDKNTVFTSTYSCVYAVPLSFFGERWTDMLLNDRDYLLNGIVELDGKHTTNVDCDVVLEDGTYVLVFFIPDVSRLERFVRAANMDRKGNYMLICFEEQEQELEFLIERNITLNSFSFEEIYKEWKQ